MQFSTYLSQDIFLRHFAAKDIIEYFIRHIELKDVEKRIEAIEQGFNERR